MPNLNGKTALVTGASRGIGAAIARRLAREGASVAITYSSSPHNADEVVNSITCAGGKAVAIHADAADPKDAARAVTQTVQQLGALDILINNAGVNAAGEITQFADEQFERILAINVRAVYYTVKEAARNLRDNGRIILIGSVNSDTMPFPGGSVYALTKGAVASFTRGLARDLAPRNITVNNLQPGPINTELNPADGPFSEMLKSRMAIKRFGTPEEIAALVAFLCSPEAAFITGAGIKIDGGFDA